MPTCITSENSELGGVLVVSPGYVFPWWPHCCEVYRLLLVKLQTECIENSLTKIVCNTGIVT